MIKIENVPEKFNAAKRFRYLTGDKPPSLRILFGMDYLVNVQILKEPN